MPPTPLHAQDISFSYLHTVVQSPGNNLPAIEHGDIQFVDINHDGDLDIFASGRSRQPVAYVAEGLRDELITIDRAQIWHRFFSSPQSFTAVWKGAASDADFDGDGQIEFFMTGATMNELPGDPAILIGAGGSVQTVSTDGYFNAAQAAGDYDNDGDVDVLVTGIDSTQQKISRLWMQDNGFWTSTSVSLPGVGYGSAASCDFDGDGDLDVFIGGVHGDDSRRGDIYENVGGSFSARGLDLPGLLYGSADCGDFDADGDLDLLLTGGIIDPLHTTRGLSHLYRNDGGTFVRHNASLPGIMQGEAEWGDVDNDGDLDILMMGNSYQNGTGIIRIYQNNGGTFAPDLISSGIIRSDSSVDWGDYDGDGDLDFLVTGNFGRLSLRLYRNDAPSSNEAPDAPSGLTAAVTGSSVTLSWQPAADDHTPTQSLTYNLRVGTSSGGIDIAAPGAHPQTGKQWRSQSGNAGLGTSHELRDLPSGTYYWSVQTLDTSFKGSPFAPEGTFVIP